MEHVGQLVALPTAHIEAVAEGVARLQGKPAHGDAAQPVDKDSDLGSESPHKMPKLSHEKKQGAQDQAARRCRGAGSELPDIAEGEPSARNAD